MDLIELVYVAAGIALPLYYVPQIQRCLADQTRLASYSLSKSAVQVALRLLMLPFIVGVGNATMVTIVVLDLVGRGAELGSAVFALRRQSQSWRSIGARAVHASASSPADAASVGPEREAGATP